MARYFNGSELMMCVCKVNGPSRKNERCVARHKLTARPGYVMIAPTIRARLSTALAVSLAAAPLAVSDPAFAQMCTPQSTGGSTPIQGGKTFTPATTWSHCHVYFLRTNLDFVGVNTESDDNATVNDVTGLIAN